MPLRNAFYGFVLGAIFSTNGMAKPFPKGAGIVCPVRDANLANESWTDSAAKWSAFISAMGARYDGYNLVRAVTM